MSTVVNTKMPVSNAYSKKPQPGSKEQMHFPTPPLLPPSPSSEPNKERTSDLRINRGPDIPIMLLEDLGGATLVHLRDIFELLDRVLLRCVVGTWHFERVG